ncbi:hypothetical protein [Neobacillus terrae]|uniref:hypothetical protein n=1 Tax=Neobacillus terrae TaxID=3034837 RepID=UPI00140B80BF|nr:hypothetical protein [Neobacillus terrae]NHM31109.1 hypothetical protein [Neobacillus terrae]
MNHLEGRLLSGVYDAHEKEFAIQRVKSFQIESILNEKMTQSLFFYLQKQEEDKEGMVLTLNDQMPVLLSHEEVCELLEDLHKVKSMFQQ